MHYLSPLLTLVLVAALTAAQTDSKPATNLQAAAHLFDYDAKQPLDIYDKVIDQFKGGTLHDITYTSPKGGPVEAYLVVPNGNGPFAAVLFGHGKRHPGWIHSRSQNLSESWRGFANS